MPKQRKVVVIGKPRSQIDPGLMAQVILALAKQMQAKQRRQQRRRRGASPEGRS